MGSAVALLPAAQERRNPRQRCLFKFVVLKPCQTAHTANAMQPAQGLGDHYAASTVDATAQGWGQEQACAALPCCTTRANDAPARTSVLYH